MNILIPDKKQNMKKKTNPDIKKIIDVDRVIHEPARIAILSLLFVIESADFLFIMNQTGLTQGNLSSHLSKLEDASLIEIMKSFRGKRPHTEIRLTVDGRERFKSYLASVKGFLGEI
jgi:DNA-binding transcriptional ArsR family regulator